MNDLKSSIHKLNLSLENFVRKYGIAQSIFKNVSGKDSYVHNDFIHFCITKGSKHLLAAECLLENGFGEDAIILIRCAYECYITASYAIDNPDPTVNKLVYDKLGLYSGKLQYAETKKGKIDYRNIVRKKGDAKASAPPTFEKIIFDLNCPEDIAVHRAFYNLTSEHTHVHMVASGNYREGYKYKVRDPSQVSNGELLGAYIGTLLLNIACNYENISDIEGRQCRILIDDTKNALIDLIRNHYQESELLSLIVARLNAL